MARVARSFHSPGEARPTPVRLVVGPAHRHAVGGVSVHASNGGAGVVAFVFHFREIAAVPADPVAQVVVFDAGAGVVGLRPALRLAAAPATGGLHRGRIQRRGRLVHIGIGGARRRADRESGFRDLRVLSVAAGGGFALLKDRRRSLHGSRPREPVECGDRGNQDRSSMAMPEARYP